MLASKVKSSFRIPAHNKIALQIHTEMNSSTDEVVAIITQNIMTGVFTLFIDKGEGFQRTATGRTPDFPELDTLIKR